MVTPMMSCPSGGSFYACADGSLFVGYCLNNPCADGCSAGSLVLTSFDALRYNQILDQSCGAGKAQASFTCVYARENNSTFWGCCSINPCAAGSCPRNDILGAVLSNNAQEAAVFLSLNSSYTATVSESASSCRTSKTSDSASAASVSAQLTCLTASPTTSFTTASSISTSTNAQASSAAAATTISAPTATVVASQHSTAAGGGNIAGGVVGGSVVLVAMTLILIYLLRRRRESVPSAQSTTTLPRRVAGLDQNPTYSMWSCLLEACSIPRTLDSPC